MTVYKYPLPMTDVFDLTLPGGARLLSVQPQNDTPCLWALVDPTARGETREFRWFGTGQPIAESLDTFDFVGTVQLRGGALVFHLFVDRVALVEHVG